MRLPLSCLTGESQGTGLTYNPTIDERDDFSLHPIHLPVCAILHHPWNQPHPTVNQVAKNLLFCFV